MRMYDIFILGIPILVGRHLNTSTRCGSGHEGAAVLLPGIVIK